MNRFYSAVLLFISFVLADSFSSKVFWTNGGRLKTVAASKESGVERVVTLKSNDELLELASVSSHKGAVLVVGYFSILEDSKSGILESLSSLAEVCPECNFAKVAKEFDGGQALMDARMVTALPSVEVIADGKRLSLTAGLTEGLSSAREALKSRGFEIQEEPPPPKEIEFSLASPLGWRRSVAELAVTFVSENGQAAQNGVCVGDVIVAIDGLPVQTDAQYENAIAKAKERGDRLVVRLVDAASAPKSLASQAAAAYSRQTGESGPKPRQPDFFMADGDARSSGNFQTWTPGMEDEKKRNEAAGKPARVTSNFFPGGRNLEEAAERLVSEVEDFLTRESDSDEVEGGSKKNKKKGKK